jgi:hypothetical protein
MVKAEKVTNLVGYNYTKQHTPGWKLLP